MECGDINPSQNAFIDNAASPTHCNWDSGVHSFHETSPLWPNQGVFDLTDFNISGKFLFKKKKFSLLLFIVYNSILFYYSKCALFYVFIIIIFRKSEQGDGF